MRGRLNGDVPERTRVEAGRKRAQAAKRTVALTAATGFAVAIALVRAGHPATATSPSSSSGSRPASSSSSEEREREGTLGGGSIAPSSRGPAPVATATS